MCALETGWVGKPWQASLDREALAGKPWQASLGREALTGSEKAK